MKLTLLSKKDEVAGVVSFVFKPSARVVWKAGQFFHYVLHHEPTDNRGSDRWFTVASAPYEDSVMLTTRFTSDTGSSFKKALGTLQIGDAIEISDVDGDFTVEDPSEEYVFIAGGIGITPFRAILKQLVHEGKSISGMLLYANRDENSTYKEELESVVQNNPTFNIHYITSPDRVDEKKIREMVPDLQKPIFYISGPEPMVEALGKTLKTMGVTDDHIKQDWFPGYPAE